MAFDFNSIQDSELDSEDYAGTVMLDFYIKALKEVGDDYCEGEIIEVNNVELSNSHDFGTERVKAIVECRADKERLDLTTIFYGNINRSFGSRITVNGAENMAKLLKYFNVDITDIRNMLDNLIEALADYGRERGFDDSTDFKPLLEGLSIPYTVKNLD